MTVKTKKRGRPGADKLQLTAEVITVRAKELLLEDGKIPSIRKIAGTLDVDAMAIYHYFANKQALLAAVTVSLVREIYQPVDNGDWQEELQRLCLSYVQLLKAYPGLLETLLTMSEEGPAEVFAQRFRLALMPLQLSDTDIKNALDLLADYLHGFALALNCNPDGTLEADMMEGPIQLYMKALAASDATDK